jgi:hypothetical protein
LERRQLTRGELNSLVYQLHYAIFLLAADADEQRKYLERYDFDPIELAEQLADYYSPTNIVLLELSQPQIEALAALDAKVPWDSVYQMDLDSLNEPIWEEIRVKARLVLESFGYRWHPGLIEELKKVWPVETTDVTKIMAAPKDAVEPPLRLDKIRTWLESKLREVPSGINFVVLPVSRDNLWIGANFSTSSTAGRLDIWRLGFVDFEVTRRGHGPPVFRKHQNVSTLDDPHLENDFQEFLRVMFAEDTG